MPGHILEWLLSVNRLLVIGCKEHNRLGDIVGCAGPAEWNDFGSPLQTFLRSSSGGHDFENIAVKIILIRSELRGASAFNFSKNAGEMARVLKSCV
jgi:hypothetical protein